MLGADGEIAQLFGPGIDDLVRRFPAAREGSGEVRIGEARYPIRTGDIIACPVNTKNISSLAG